MARKKSFKSKKSNIISSLFLFCSWFIYSQQDVQNSTKKYHFIGLGSTMGITLKPYPNFAEIENQHNINLTIGVAEPNSNLNWQKYLNYPKTGLLLSYTDFGNHSIFGQATSLVPFIEFPIFNQWTHRMSLQTGLGVSYFNRTYTRFDNYINIAVSTHLTWAFKAYLKYQFLSTDKLNLNIGAGFEHNSNGHIRLPNAGLNSFLVGINSELYYNKKEIKAKTDETVVNSTKPEKQNYYSIRMGYGQNVLTIYDFTKKDVATIAISYGRIKNQMFKYGVGVYYRFYENYYDYIKNDEFVVKEIYPNLKNNPILSASNIGLFTEFEYLMSHISIEFGLGVNLYKPAYKVDWQVNKGVNTIEAYRSATNGFKYKASSVISSKLGLRYYAFNTNKSPIHNLFLATTINANLGQADFGELSIGYIYSPKKH